ncbi:MAG: response regulator transcription factor [Clostridia bacterium]|nr:response regulator transcription factor [Clostridia bacterium]
MYRLLVVDDEEMIRRLIRKYASFEGHTVDEASDGREAVRKCRENQYDLVIMDVMMPDLNGYSACSEIRKFSDIPIIMLSARGAEYDRISAFELGVDDYVVKPFSPKELMLRIEAILKRGKGTAKKESDDKVFVLGGLTINQISRIVSADGKKLDLSPKEYDLLFYLVNNRNVALSRDKIISEVWGYDFYGDERTLDTHIKLLRRSLGDYAKHVVTLRGVGYRFDTEADGSSN